MPLAEHRIIDSNKRTLVKYVFTAIDGTQSANTVLVDTSTLAYALSNTGNVMVANTNPRPLYRSSIKRIFGTARTAGSVTLSWHGGSNSAIISFGTGNFDLNFNSMGDGAVLTNPEANASGDILVSSTGLALGDCYTLLIDLRKDTRDYDQGQSGSPIDYNKPGIP
jgi:hypothetical protein